MFKQTPSRNHRGKSLRIKYAIKIFILVAICIWLLYQVKHSRDQKRAFEAGDGNVLSSTLVEDISPKIFDADRKVRMGMKRNHEDEAVEDDEARDTKSDENEDDNGTGDDKVDEDDSEKGVDDANHLDGQQVGDDKEHHPEKSGLLEQKDQYVLEANSQEAREKNYREDDASSAVVRETQSTGTEVGGDNLGEIIRQQVEKPEKKELDFEYHKSNGTSETDRLGIIQGQGEKRNGTSVIHEEETESTANEKPESDNQSNATSDSHSNILPGDGSNHLLFNETLTNVTETLTLDGNGAISDPGLPQLKRVEVNSTGTELLLESSMEKGGNLILVHRKETTNHSDENGSIPLDLAHDRNSTFEDAKMASSDAGNETHGNIVINQTEGNNSIASLKEQVENSKILLSSSVITGNDTQPVAPFNSTEGQSLSDGNSHLASLVDIEGDTPNTTNKSEEAETSLPTASQELHEGSGHKLSVSPSNFTTGLEDKHAQIHLSEGEALKMTTATVEDA